MINRNNNLKSMINSNKIKMKMSSYKINNKTKNKMKNNHKNNNNNNNKCLEKKKMKINYNK